MLEEKSASVETSSLQLQGLQHIKDYPIKEYYRLIVDGRLHARGRGWVDYEEREQGSVAGAFRGLGYALTDLEDTILTVDYIRNLHAACMSGVNNQNSEYLPGKTKADLAKPVKILSLSIFSIPDSTIKIGRFGLCERKPDSSEDALINLTKRGLEELMNFSNTYGGTIEYCTTSEYQEFVGYFIAPKDEKNKMIQSFVENFNSDISIIDDKELKLRCIIKFISNVERLHPFMDGNIRTFVICLLNRLLLQNNFYPATFRDPNVFDGFSQDELFDEVTKAMDISRQIILQAKREESGEFFGFRTPGNTLGKNEKNEDYIQFKTIPVFDSRTGKISLTEESSNLSEPYRQAVEKFSDIISSEHERIMQISHDSRSFRNSFKR